MLVSCRRDGGEVVDAGVERVDAVLSGLIVVARPRSSVSTTQGTKEEACTYDHRQAEGPVFRVICDRVDREDGIDATGLDEKRLVRRDLAVHTTVDELENGLVRIGERLRRDAKEGVRERSGIETQTILREVRFESGENGLNSRGRDVRRLQPCEHRCTLERMRIDPQRCCTR